MLALPYLSALFFTGPEAGDFLHNQLSADVLELDAGQSTFACYCEPKGRVLALMLVSKNEQGYCVVMSRSLTAAIAERLRIYVMRTKVTIEVPNDCLVIGIRANTESQTPSPAFTIPIPNSDQYLIVSEDGTANANSSSSVEAWKCLELQRGVSWLGTESSGEFLPQMLGFDTLGAVNYGKGCYPGQEIVARTHYLGKVKRHPRLLNTQEPIQPMPMDKIVVHHVDKTFEAIVVDSAPGEDGTGYVLAVTRMGPELSASKIEFEGQPINLIT